VTVGTDPASAIYVRNKRKACDKVGIRSIAHDLPASTSETDLFTLIDSINHRPLLLMAYWCNRHFRITLMKTN
jgi:5,10-methylene-tetrahydrofolate dehydrogenase/methenyl tetrahydrofolate cyclohydrolase